MARDISIAYSARDQLSPALNSMRNSNQGLSKDLEEAAQKIDNLNKRQDSLAEGLGKSRQKLDETSSALKQAKKDFEQYGEVLGKDYMSKFYQEHEEAKQQVKDFEDTIRSTRREVNGLSDDMNRAGNRAGGFGGDMMSSLAGAGLFKMVGDSAANAANVLIGSAFGDAMGDAISTTMSGVIDGAAMGSLAGGLPGAAIGAGVGLVAGGISAATQSFARFDDVFKGEVQRKVAEGELYLASTLSGGIVIASSLETGARQLEALFDGDKELAGSFNESLYEIGRTPPFSYDTALGLSRKMLGLGLSPEEALDRVNSLSDAAGALGLESVSSIVNQLEYVRTSGKLEPRIMKTLSSAGIDPYQALADNFRYNGEKLTPERAAELFKDSKAVEALDPDDFYDAMYRYMGIRFKGAAGLLENTYEGQLGIRQSYEDEMNAAMGRGFMDESARSMREQNAWFSSDDAEQMEEALSMAGKGKAEREALERQYLQDARTAVFGSGNISSLFTEADSDRLRGLAQEYRSAKDENNNIKIESLIQEVAGIANTAFLDSPEMKTLADSQRELVNSIQENTADHQNYMERMLEKQNEISEGVNSIKNFSLIDMVEGSAGFSGRSAAKLSGNAWGIPYVPYDDYITRLHEGERVLTASEARAQSKGGECNININTPSVVIREEADIYKIAQGLATELKKARLIT